MSIIQVYAIAPTNDLTDEKEKRLSTTTLTQYMIQYQDVMSPLWLCEKKKKKLVVTTLIGRMFWSNMD